MISDTIDGCIKFEEIPYKADDDSNHIMITCEDPDKGTYGQGCWSMLGMIGGRQRMSLETPNCAKVKTKAKVLYNFKWLFCFDYIIETIDSLMV